MVYGVIGRQHRCNCGIDKTKTNKMVFSTEDRFNESSSSRKRLRQLMNNHTASLEITVNVRESMLSRKLVFWTSN